MSFFKNCINFAFIGAISWYKRAINVQPSSAPLIRSNMAATMLELGRFYEAYQEATQALEGGATEEKALFRSKMCKKYVDERGKY